MNGGLPTQNTSARAGTIPDQFCRSALPTMMVGAVTNGRRRRKLPKLFGQLHIGLMVG